MTRRRRIRTTTKRSSRCIRRAVQPRYAARPSMHTSAAGATAPASVVQRHASPALVPLRRRPQGVPIAGLEMILGITQERLLVWRPALMRSRPRRFAGAVPLARDPERGRASQVVLFGAHDCSSSRERSSVWRRCAAVGSVGSRPRSRRSHRAQIPVISARCPPWRRNSATRPTPSCSSSTATTSARRRAANVAVYDALRARRRDQRDAHGAVPLGARRRRDVPRRRRRRAPHAQRPSGRPTAGDRSPTPRACSTATAASRARCTTCGTTATSTRSARSAAPRSSGPFSGASTSAISTVTWARFSSAAEFFDVYLEMAVDFGLPMRMPGASANGRSVSRSAASRPRRASCSPTTSCTCRRRRPRARSRRPCSTCGPASPRSTCTRRSTAPSCARSHPDWAARVEDHAFVTNDPSFAGARGTRPAPRSSASASCATCNGRADRANGSEDARAARAPATRAGARRSRRPSSRCRA